MPTVIFIHTDGRREPHEAPLGDSVMDCAVDNKVVGIIGHCGGACNCSTCHCYVGPAWFNLLPMKIEDEKDLLAYVFELRANSRLACQLKLTAALDGIEVHLPARQI